MKPFVIENIIEQQKYFEEISKNLTSSIDGCEDLSQELPFYDAGHQFCTKGSNAIKTYIVNKDGNIELTRNLVFSIEEEPRQIKIERTMAQVISFDNNCVIARVYFESHHSTRKFKKLFVDRLKEKDLLYKNAYFNIVTKKNEDGSLNFDIEDCDDFSDPDIANMYGEIFKDL